MTTMEKNMIVGVIVCFIGIIGSCAIFLKNVNEAGGIKQIVIEAGKEIKDISREIDKE